MQWSIAPLSWTYWVELGMYPAFLSTYDWTHCNKSWSTPRRTQVTHPPIIEMLKLTCSTASVSMVLNAYLRDLSSRKHKYLMDRSRLPVVILALLGQCHVVVSQGAHITRNTTPTLPHAVTLHPPFRDVVYARLPARLSSPRWAECGRKSDQLHLPIAARASLAVAQGARNVRSRAPGQRAPPGHEEGRVLLSLSRRCCQRRKACHERRRDARLHPCSFGGTQSGRGVGAFPRADVRVAEGVHELVPPQCARKHRPPRGAMFRHRWSVSSMSLAVPR